MSDISKVTQWAKGRVEIWRQVFESSTCGAPSVTPELFWHQWQSLLLVVPSWSMKWQPPPPGTPFHCSSYRSHCCCFTELAPWGFYPIVLLQAGVPSSDFFTQLCWFLLGLCGPVLTSCPHLLSTPGRQPGRRGASLHWDQTVSLLQISLRLLLPDPCGLLMCVWRSNISVFKD